MSYLDWLYLSHDTKVGDSMENLFSWISGHQNTSYYILCKNICCKGRELCEKKSTLAEEVMEKKQTNTHISRSQKFLEQQNINTKGILGVFLHSK